MAHRPIHYFPFESDQFQLRMDVRPCADAWIEVDDHYHADIRLKEEILKARPDRYHCCPPEAEAAALETIELLLPEMARRYPSSFQLEERDGALTWTNHLLGRRPESLPPTDPLDWIGRQVQEDLLLMTPDAEGRLRLTAGHLCFGSKWSLDEKIRHDVLEMHAPVPGFAEQMGKPSQLLMARLKPGHPAQRVNWAINATHRLNLDPALRHEWEPSAIGITPENAGERCFLRIERQVFHRLPRTGALLMTIRTYLHSIAAVAADAGRRQRLASVLRSAPAVTLDYKGISPFAAALLGYLEGAGS